MRLLNAAIELPKDLLRKSRVVVTVLELLNLGQGVCLLEAFKLVVDVLAYLPPVLVRGYRHFIVFTHWLCHCSLEGNCHFSGSVRGFHRLRLSQRSLERFAGLLVGFPALLLREGELAYQQLIGSDFLDMCQFDVDIVGTRQDG